MIDSGTNKKLHIPFQHLCYVIDTADRRQDPQLVADPDPPVLPRVAQECPGRHFRQLCFLGRIPGIGQGFRQIGFQILDMHMGPPGNRFYGMTDGKTILDDVFSLCNVAKSNLMAGGNLLHGGNTALRQGKDGARSQGFQSNRHIVRRIDTKESRHGKTLQIIEKMNQGGLQPSL